MAEREHPSGPSIDEPANGETSSNALLEQLAQAQAQAAEYLDNWRRAIADLSNARKRMQREMDDCRATASAGLLEKLLPVVDDVDRAFTVVPAEQAETDWVNGFRMIQRKLHSLLEGEGVTTISTEGLLFDPAVHYAVTHEEADGFNDGQIIAELVSGYKLNDKVLRPAMVRVAKGN
jgi:molecular chaperone GrpE